jgi:flavin-binding protein dodecin
MTDHVYKTVEITGSSKTTPHDAIEAAVKKAGETLRHLDWFEVVQTRGTIVDGAVDYYQVTLKIGFRLE